MAFNLLLILMIVTLLEPKITNPSKDLCLKETFK